MRQIRLFERPLGADAVLAPLGIVGSLPEYIPATAYYGELDIINSVGKCRVELISGNLPAGYKLYVDNFTKKIKLEWPAYNSGIKQGGVINGDFENDIPLFGWTARRGNDYNDPVSGEYPESPSSYTWEEYQTTKSGPPTLPDNHAAVCRGTGTHRSHVLESDFYSVEPNEIIAQTRALWDQGPSNSDNNNLFTVLAWFDYTKDFISETRGDNIYKASNNARHYSTITNAQAPNNAHWVKIRLLTDRRNSRNRAVTVDDVSWTHEYAVGMNTDEEYYITLRVYDSANRNATWSGVLSATYIYRTSRPYPVDLLPEGIQMLDSAILTGAFRDSPQAGTLPEGVEVGCVIASGQFRSPLTEYNTGLPEGIDMSIKVASGEFRSPLVTYNTGLPEGIDMSIKVASGVFKQTLITANTVPEGINTSIKVASGVFG